MNKRMVRCESKSRDWRKKRKPNLVKPPKPEPNLHVVEGSIHEKSTLGKEEMEAFYKKKGEDGR